MIESDHKSGTSIEQKLAAKQSAHNARFGSPKLRDLLIQKCRIRIKNARHESFNNKRDLTALEQNIVQSVISDELKEMEFDIDLQDVIYKEIIAKTDEWLFDTYEKVETDLVNNALEDNEFVFCPICQKDKLIESNECVSCEGCGVKLHVIDSLSNYHKKIISKGVQHEFNCTNHLTFFAEPINGTNQAQLNGFCDVCDFLCEI